MSGTTSIEVVAEPVLQLTTELDVCLEPAMPNTIGAATLPLRLIRTTHSHQLRPLHFLDRPTDAAVQKRSRMNPCYQGRNHYSQPDTSNALTFR